MCAFLPSLLIREISEPAKLQFIVSRKQVLKDPIVDRKVLQTYLGHRKLVRNKIKSQLT